jgi:hypothetical protein
MQFQICNKGLHLRFAAKSCIQLRLLCFMKVGLFRALIQEDDFKTQMMAKEWEIGTLIREPDSKSAKDRRVPFRLKILV